MIARETDWVLDASCPAFLAHVAGYLWSAAGRSRVVHAAELVLVGKSPHLATQVPHGDAEAERDFGSDSHCAQRGQWSCSDVASKLGSYAELQRAIPTLRTG